MSPRRSVLGLAAADVLMLAGGCLSLTISCVILSPKKYFWNDELFSWYLVADPSFSHMWKAFSDELNNTPPLYFVLGWGWARIFGASELSLRLFSSLGFSAGLVLVWAMLRRVYGFWPSWIGTLVVFLTSKLVLAQNPEARMYGLFVALAAAAVYQYESLNRRDHYTLRDLACIAAVHGALVNTHLLAPFYSGAALVAYATTDLQRKTPRWGIYVAIVIGWLCFLLYLPAFLVQIGAGRPRAWMRRLDRPRRAVVCVVCGREVSLPARRRSRADVRTVRRPRSRGWERGRGVGGTPAARDGVCVPRGPGGNVGDISPDQADLLGSVPHPDHHRLLHHRGPCHGAIWPGNGQVRPYARRARHLRPARLAQSSLVRDCLRGERTAGDR